MKTLKKILLSFGMILSLTACFNETNPDIFVMGAVPNEVEIQGNKYENSNEMVEMDRLEKLFGFIINQEDYELWVKYDNNPTLYYEINENNGCFNETSPAKGQIDFRDRYGIYTIKESENLAIFACAAYWEFIKISN